MGYSRCRDELDSRTVEIECLNLERRRLAGEFTTCRLARRRDAGAPRHYCAALSNASSNVPGVTRSNTMGGASRFRG